MSGRPDLEKRREIARKALALIRERGVSHLGMNELADALGMKRPALFRHFHDLAEVLDAAIDETYREFEANLAHRLPVHRHPIELLEGLLEVNLGFIQEHAAEILVLIQLWARAAASDPDRAVERGRKFLAPLRASLLRQVEAGIASGKVRPCNAAGVVDLVLTLMDGAMIQQLVHRTDLVRLHETACGLLDSLKREPQS